MEGLVLWGATRINLGTIAFLIFINDIVSDIGSNIRLFADDTSMYLVLENPDIAVATLQSDIDKVSNWADKWHVDFNPYKSKYLLISRNTGVNPHPSLYMNGVQVSPASDHKHLALQLSGNGTWQSHIEYMKTKAWERINIMRKLKFKLDRKALETIYHIYKANFGICRHRLGQL